MWVAVRFVILGNIVSVTEVTRKRVVLAQW